MRTDIERPANEAGFAIELRLTVEAVIEALKAWLTRQTDQAIISHTLILLNSLKRGSSLSQIAENFSHWEAAVRAAR